MKETVNILQEILNKIIKNEDMNFNIISYSGRFMYGKKCLGITGNEINQILLGYFIKKYDMYSELKYDYDLNVIRSDNFGLGIVIYFPKIPYIEEDEEDEKNYLVIDEA